MSDETTIEQAPQEHEVMEVHRAQKGHGWRIDSEGKTVACFSTVSDMTSWMETYLTPLDEEAGIIPRKSGPIHGQPSGDPIPAMFTRPEPSKPASGWRVLIGGRR